MGLPLSSPITLLPGRHEAPTADSLPRFLARWAEVYGRVRRGEASVIALAASHHRLTWMHPFLDGNGRVARLHTHLLLHAWGLTNGLWSPLRGFARSEARYKALLQAADEHRRGDRDGRGNLSQSSLVDWINYTLDLCIDQIEFMSLQFDVQRMREPLLRRVQHLPGSEFVQIATANEKQVETEARTGGHHGKHIGFG